MGIVGDSSPGLSPRTRGKRDKFDEPPSRNGPIPADAGETLLHPAEGGKRGAYPRGRGGNVVVRRSMSMRRGLSPRTRGKPLSSAMR